MATRMQQRRGTAAQWTSANPVLGAGEIGFETDTNKFKIGDGVLTWANLDYFTTIDQALLDIVDGAPAALNTLNELAAALGDDANYATTITNALSDKADVIKKTGAAWTADSTPIPANKLAISTDGFIIKLGNGTDTWTNTPKLATFSDLTTEITNAITTLEGDLTNSGTFNDGTFNNANFTGTVTLSSSTSIGDVSSTEIGYLNGVTSAIQTQITDLSNSLNNVETTVAADIALKANLSGPTFTGTVILPTTTSIGDVSSTEIGYVNGVTSAIQTQLDSKADSATVSTTYAPLAGPTFTGTVTLPNTTSIGTVDSSEIAYLNGVTSAIQTQLDAKAPTASPTFTGTVSGITATMVGLGNVDNTSDANKPVSTATQTALDGKLSLSGGTMTGDIVLAGAPTQALHPATKAYADSIAEGLHIHPSCVAATTANVDLSNALENGDVVDGVTLVTGDRVLVKNQTTTSQNGIYVVQASGAAVRATDFDAPAEVDGGDFVFVTGGTVNNDTGWVQTSTGMTTIGTDPITFTQFSGAGTITAGTNISVSGNQVSTVNNPTFSGLITASSGVAFSDGTQTLEGVPSRTPISQQTGAYNLSTGGLSLRDTLIEISHTGGSAVQLTIPADSTTNFPVGTSIDVVRTNTGGVTIAGAGGVTVNGTPGLTLRAQWSSATLFKRAANTWLVMGDLTA